MAKKNSNVANKSGTESTKNPFDNLQPQENYTRLPIMPYYPREKPKKQGGYGYVDLLDEVHGKEPIIVD